MADAAQLGQIAQAGWHDHAALRASCEAHVGLCTIIAVEGSFSRRVGTQLAVQQDGSTIGSLADGCLEKELAAEMSQARRDGKARIRRFGKGSDIIDFRLPCGGGLDILVDPVPDRDALRRAVEQLDQRQPAVVPLAGQTCLSERRYLPQMKLAAFGEGPELVALERLAKAAGYGIEAHHAGSDALMLGEPPREVALDAWTAVILLFHDHEWEASLLDWAFASPAFFIGAQGGERARERRFAELLTRGVDERHLARLTSPVGAIPHCREPVALALSTLAQVAGAYEALHPHR